MAKPHAGMISSSPPCRCTISATTSRAASPITTRAAAEAADAVKAFHPKVVIPHHYKGQDVQVFKTALDGSGINVRLLEWYPE